MNDATDRRFAAIEDRLAIRDLAYAFGDAVNTYDVDAFANLLARDAVWEIEPPMDVQTTGRESVVGLFNELMANWRFFHQMVFPGGARLTDAGASARVYMQEVGLYTSGKTFRTWGYYDDDYVREDGGWKFAKRHFRFLYIDEPPMEAVYLVDSVKVG